MRPVILALVLSSSACYSYQHVDTASTTATAVARVELTDAGTVAIAPALGEQVQIIEGPIVQNSGGALEIDVRSIRRRGESLMKEWPGDKISIPSANIRGVTVKTMNRSRTTAAIIGGTVAAIATVIVVAKSSSIFTGGGGKTIPSNIR